MNHSALRAGRVLIRLKVASQSSELVEFVPPFSWSLELLHNTPGCFSSPCHLPLVALLKFKLRLAGSDQEPNSSKTNQIHSSYCLNGLHDFNCLSHIKHNHSITLSFRFSCL